MRDGELPDDPRLVPGRTCGGCNVCCVVLTIDDPELQKVQGYRCAHAQRDNGCGIYENRPRTCRVFHCGWRSLKWVREPLRPDRSGVLVQLQGEISPTDGAKQLGVTFTLLNRAALKAEGLAESVAAAVAAGIPVFLAIPGPPGYTSARAKINAELEDAVGRKDKAGVLRILQDLYRTGRSGERRRIVITPGADGDAARPTLAPDRP
ncbi:MAG: hypothetical protein HIU82_22580, partial [Proteobacteria bacterium]|nr:hypothetical protein [Pseudomonadota bacterium]